MRWWRFFARRRRDLDEEIEAHLRMAVRDRVERGEALVWEHFLRQKRKGGYEDSRYRCRRDSLRL